MALVLQRPKKLVGGVAAVALVAAMGVAGAAGAVPAGHAGPPEHAPTAAPGDLSRIDSLATARGQETAPPQQTGPQDPSQQGEPQQGDPAQQAAVVPPPAVPQELLTPEERAALALVEQIIRDQEGVLMGTGFSYERSGRRDPFQSLLAIRGPDDVDFPPGTCPPGRLEGFRISEVVLKAIASAQGRRHAMITGPNQRAYFLEVGSELCDGHVSEITPTQVFFEQVVLDMSGAQRYREVTKQLTTDSGGGQTP